MLGFYLPQEGQHQLHQLGTRDHFLVKDDQAAQEVVISLGASQGFPHLEGKTETSERDGQKNKPTHAFGDAEVTFARTFSKNRDSVPTPCLLASTTDDSFRFCILGFF